jgi:tryptophan-rich sensory protein
MGNRIKPILGAAVTGGLVSYFAVQFLFNPAMPDPAFEPIVGNLIASTALYWIVGSVFFDWAVQKMGKTMSTAMVIALSQILLVDFNYVIVGRRELEPALISVGIILVIWASVAIVYDKLSETS